MLSEEVDFSNSDLHVVTDRAFKEEGSRQTHTGLWSKEKEKEWRMNAASE